MPNIRQTTPFIFTHDLKASCAFFEGLGFEPRVIMPDPGYAYCSTGHAAVRLLELKRDMEIAEQMVYVDVEDVDQLYDDLKPFLEGLPEGRARGPINQEYGQRELHVKDPDNCLLMFGHEIRDTPTD